MKALTKSRSKVVKSSSKRLGKLMQGRTHYCMRNPFPAAQASSMTLPGFRILFGSSVRFSVAIRAISSALRLIDR